MKSLESLNILYQTHCSNCMPAITQSEKELWDGIENDLKVLEILKRNLSEDFSLLLTNPPKHKLNIILTQDDYEKIEKWLGKEDYYEYEKDCNCNSKETLKHHLLDYINTKIEMDNNDKAVLDNPLQYIEKCGALNTLFDIKKIIREWKD